jgi:hypothetical protein
MAKLICEPASPAYASAIGDTSSLVHRVYGRASHTSFDIPRDVRTLLSSFRISASTLAFLPLAPTRAPLGRGVFYKCYNLSTTFPLEARAGRNTRPGNSGPVVLGCNGWHKKVPATSSA